MNNLLLSFATPPRRLEALETRLLGAWDEAAAAAARRAAWSSCRSSTAARAGRTWRTSSRIPASTSRRSSRSTARRSTRSTRSAAIPGYCYLGGMDPRIATPRRKVPVLSIPGGAVSIGGAQTGVSASDGPSGWNTIGTTDDVLLRRDARPAGAAAARRQHRLPGRRGDPDDRDPLAERARHRAGPRPRRGAALGRRHRRAPWTGWRSPAATCCSATTRTPPAIEAQVFPFEVRFEADRAFALTGADCAATLDGVPLLPWSAQPRRRRARCCGSACRRPGAGAARAPISAWPAASTCPWCSARAARSCAARSAASTGATLRQGDRLRAGAPAARRGRPASAWCRPALALPLEVDGLPAVRVLPAAEYDALHARPRAPRFWAEPWKITPQSDRYGFRLAGPGAGADRADGDALARHRAGRDPGAARRPADRADVRRPALRRLPQDRHRHRGRPLAARPGADRQPLPLRRDDWDEALAARDEIAGVARRGPAPASTSTGRGAARDDDAARARRRDRRLARGDRHRAARADRARTAGCACGAAASRRGRVEVEAATRRRRPDEPARSPSPGVRRLPARPPAARRAARRSRATRVAAGQAARAPADRSAAAAGAGAARRRRRGRRARREGTLVGFGDPLFELCSTD